MGNKKLLTFIVVLAAVFVLLGFWFMFGRNSTPANGGQVITEIDVTTMPDATKATDMISKGVSVRQDFICTTDTIKNIGIVFTRLQYVEGVNLVLELLNGNNSLARTIVPVTQVEDQHRVFIEPNGILRNVKDAKLTIKIYSENGENTGLALMVSENVDTNYWFNNRKQKGSICFSVVE